LFANPVTTTGLEVPVAVILLGDEIAVYENIGPPVAVDGAVNATLTPPPPVDGVPIVGALAGISITLPTLGDACPVAI
jgi:hypothetical protein